MTEQKVGFGTKLEEAFLGLLRVVILLVLTVSLIASCYFVFSGFSDMKAEPQEYKAEQFNGDNFIKEIKDQFEEKKQGTSEQPPAKSKKADQKVNKALEDELDKQIAIISDFLKRSDNSLNDPRGFKSTLRNDAVSLASKKTDEGAVAYAVAQTAFFELVFKNPEILTLEEKYRNSQTGDFLNTFFPAAVSYYPNFLREQVKKKRDFDNEQQAEVAAAKQGAMLKLYMAAGFFAAFLLISLILVLVKIERDLRFKQ